MPDGALLFWLRHYSRSKQAAYHRSTLAWAEYSALLAAKVCPWSELEAASRVSYNAAEVHAAALRDLRIARGEQ